MANLSCQSAALENSSTYYTYAGVKPCPVNSLANSVIDSFLMPVLSSIGIIGNIINIVTIVMIVKHLKRHSTEDKETCIYMGLAALGVADILFCVSVFPKVFVAEHEILFEELSFFLYYQAYSSAVVSTWILVSTWLIVVLAATRYLGICHPLQARAWVRHKTAYVSIATVWTLCIFFNSPSFWMLQILPIEDQFYIDLGPTSHYTTVGYAFHWLRAIIGVGIPILLLSYFNTCLIVEVYRSFDLQRNNVSSAIMTKRKLQRNRMTTTLVMVVLIFVIFVFPSEFMDFSTHLLDLVEPDEESFIIARRITNVLQVIKFSLNFLLYCIFNYQYRRCVRAILCRRRTNNSSLRRGSRPTDTYLSLKRISDVKSTMVIQI